MEDEQASANFRKAVLVFRRCFTRIAALPHILLNDQRRGAYLFLFQTISHALEIARELEAKLEFKGTLESYDYGRLTSKTVFLPRELCTARPGLLNVVESYDPRHEFVAFYDTISQHTLRENIFCCDIIPFNTAALGNYQRANCQGGKKFTRFSEIETIKDTSHGAAGD